MNDEYYMREALSLARRGLGKVSPNPMVGAVFVRDGRVVGRGYHRRFGGNHAEIEAIHDAEGNVDGATLYVTLEPCCHYGKKTPPCLDTLLKYDLAGVVIGALDPNPQVNGRSVSALRERGVETRVGVLGEQCRTLNEVYFKYIRTGTPFVTLKFAQTLDGRIASASGDSRWISSEPSLKLAHRLRGTHDAVMVGIGTVIRDDPELTVRLVRGRNPVRVVVDSGLRIPVNSRVLKDPQAARTIIATTARADGKNMAALKDLGVEVLTIGSDAMGEVDLAELLERLGEMQVSSVLVEGGAALATSLIRQGLVDRVVVIVAPRIMGTGINAVGDLGVPDVEHALRLMLTRAYRSGVDLVLELSPTHDAA